MLTVRKAGEDDCELLWTWANDPAVRGVSFHPDPIPWVKHNAWYREKLSSPDTRIWILELSHVPVAQIRYDRIDAETAEIDFSVVAERRGRGFGTKVLLSTARRACQELGVRRLKGVALRSNEASVRSFIKAGFESVGLQDISKNLCQVFVRECSMVEDEAS
jgi:RimJ/RimL family protein N-acetyltransferase